MCVCDERWDCCCCRGQCDVSIKKWIWEWRNGNSSLAGTEWPTDRLWRWRAHLHLKMPSWAWFEIHCKHKCFEARQLFSLGILWFMFIFRFLSFRFAGQNAGGNRVAIRSDRMQLACMWGRMRWRWKWWCRWHFNLLRSIMQFLSMDHRKCCMVLPYSQICRGHAWAERSDGEPVFVIPERSLSQQTSQRQTNLASGFQSRIDSGWEK